MQKDRVILSDEELGLLEEIQRDEWVDKALSENEKKLYSNSASYTKSLQEKKQTTIRFSVSDLALIKARAKKLGMGYQNLIQALVHNYAHGKVSLEL